MNSTILVLISFISLAQSFFCDCFIALTCSTFSRLLLDATKGNYILWILQMGISIGLSKHLVRYGWLNTGTVFYVVYAIMESFDWSNG